MKKIPTKEILMDKVWATIRIAWNYENKLHRVDIDNWLNNFTGKALSLPTDSEDNILIAKEREQLIALFLLCNFVLYNEDEVKYLTRLMFEKYIHSYFACLGVKHTDSSSINKLLRETQFAPLGQVSESSSYLLYHFRQENKLSKNNFKDNGNIRNIVFVDDFSVSGTQAKEYIEEYKTRNADYLKGKELYFLIMIATDEALNLLNSIEGLKVLPCVTMDDRSKVFSDTSIIFDNYCEDIKTDAKKVCEYYGKILYDKSNPLGFNNGGYLFGSYYNIPDNTLPIFWADRDDWNYLFKRYDKIYGNQSVELGGRYV